MTTSTADDPEWRRPPPTPREQRVDLLIGLVATGLALVSLELSQSIGIVFDEGPARPERWAWAVACTLPLCWRRRFPVAVLLAITAAFVGMQTRLVFEPVVSPIALLVALYTAGAWARDRRVATAGRALMVVVLLSWAGISVAFTAWAPPQEGEPLGVLEPRTASIVSALLWNVMYAAGGWIIGDLAWQDARRRTQLVERNEQLRAERAERARQAVRDERIRIAQELHDVVAHHVSVMGVQAGAARRVLDRDPEAARTAIAAVEQSSRDATEEMRKLLGMLRGPGDLGAGPAARGLAGARAEDRGTQGLEDADAPATAPLARSAEPLPDVSTLHELTSSASVDGLRVALAEVGDARPLPPGLSLSLYRIAQEALTNTVRHAAAGRADVRLRWLPEAVELEVVDDGCGVAPVTGGDGAPSGLGLVGMRERVAVHDGTLEVGPRPGGGFRVRARFPLPAPTSLDEPVPAGARRSRSS